MLCKQYHLNVRTESQPCQPAGAKKRREKKLCYFGMYMFLVFGRVYLVFLVVYLVFGMVYLVFVNLLFRMMYMVFGIMYLVLRTIYLVFGMVFEMLKGLPNVPES